jgi:dUTPase
MIQTIYQLIGEYSNAVGRYGPDSDQVRQIRAIHVDNKEFLEYADALDRIKRRLGGSGMSKLKGRNMEYRLVHPKAKIPTKNHKEDAAWDIFTPESFSLNPGDVKTINTGFQGLCDPGHFVKFFGRSKLGGKGVSVLGGVIDQYTGNWGVTLANVGREYLEFKEGDAIAQFVFFPKISEDFIEVTEFRDTQRKNKGLYSQVNRPMDSL